MAITKDDLKGIEGKRITIDGVRHRVAKVALKAGTVLTEEGAEAHMDGIYKRGPGFFYDTPKKGKKKADKAEAKPASTRARSRNKKDEDDDTPTESPRQRRRRERREREAAENGGKPTSTRARNRNKKDDDDEPATNKRARKVSRDEDDAGSPAKAKKKKMFTSFEQAIAERLAQEILEYVGPALATHGTYNVVPVAVGARFNDDSATINLTFMSAAKSAKEIKAYIRDHRESTDVAPDDEDDDQLDDDDLDDDDADDQAVTDELLGELDVADAKKIARKLGLTTKKSMDLDAVIALIREDEDNDDDAIREAAEKAGVELPEEDDDSDDDSDDDDDSDTDDDDDDDSDDDIDDDEADDDTDTDLDDDDDDTDDDDSDDTDDDDGDVSVDDMVEAITEIAPKLNTDKVRGFVEAYLASDEIEEKFGDDMVPGQTRLTAKGDDTEFLLVGYDEEEEEVKLLNLSNNKFRSKSIADAARMEIVEDDDSDD